MKWKEIVRSFLKKKKSVPHIFLVHTDHQRKFLQFLILSELEKILFELYRFSAYRGGAGIDAIPKVQLWRNRNISGASSIMLIDMFKTCRTSSMTTDLPFAYFFLYCCKFCCLPYALFLEPEDSHKYEI